MVIAPTSRAQGGEATVRAGYRRDSHALVSIGTSGGYSLLRQTVVTQFWRTRGTPCGRRRAPVLRSRCRGPRAATKTGGSSSSRSGHRASRAHRARGDSRRRGRPRLEHGSNSAKDSGQLGGRNMEQRCAGEHPVNRSAASRSRRKFWRRGGRPGPRRRVPDRPGHGGNCRRRWVLGESTATPVTVAIGHLGTGLSKFPTALSPPVWYVTFARLDLPYSPIAHSNHPSTNLSATCPQPIAILAAPTRLSFRYFLADNVAKMVFR